MEYEGAHSWSIRNIAEYAYCPRLFYLMEVEGLHIDNEHTVEGKVIHKAVDKPTSLPCAKKQRRQRDSTAEQHTLAHLVRQR